MREMIRHSQAVSELTAKLVTATISDKEYDRMPIMAGILERLFERLYDTCIVSPGMFPSVIRLFTEPLGSRGKKGWAETNMMLSGALPMPQRFIAKRIRMEILNAEQSDLEKLKEFSSVRFAVNCKHYFENPVSTLLLEDWLRKAVGQLETKNGAPREPIDHYLDEAAKKGNLVLGCFDEASLVIDIGANFQVEVLTGEPFELHYPLKVRIFLEGPEFRAVM